MLKHHTKYFTFGQTSAEAIDAWIDGFVQAGKSAAESNVEVKGYVAIGNFLIVTVAVWRSVK